jgi:formylglycine-generating enzyme required for sulfatase activity
MLKVIYNWGSQKNLISHFKENQMKELIEKINKFIKSSLPKDVSDELQKSMDAHASAEYALSLKFLSESMFILLRDEYYRPEFSDMQETMSSVQMLRDLRSSGKEIDKSSSDAILRIQERAGIESIDEIILESCYKGAIQVFENFMQENRKKEEKRNTISTKGPGKYILEEVEELITGSTEKSKITENYPKLEKIYLKYPQNKEIHKSYFLFLSEVDKHQSRVEIIKYLEKGGVSIHMGSVCISLLVELGELIEAKEWLGWYEEEYPNEADGFYGEAMVFLYSYLKEGRETDLRRLEGLSSKLVQKEGSYYVYIRNCYEIFFGREESIREKSIGIYHYKEIQFKELVKKWQQEKEKLAEELNKKKQAEVEAIKVEDKNSPVKPIEEKRMDSNPVVQGESKNIIVETDFPNPNSNPIKNLGRLMGAVVGIIIIALGAYFFLGRGHSKMTTNSIGIEFALIPSGSFQMGCSDGDADCQDEEKPQHKVTISNSFYIGKYEVTQGQWKRVMGKNPSEFQNCGEDCPVEQVSWNDAQEFISKLCEMEKMSPCKYRLPTEAEWEYAARAGSKTKYYWGDTINEEYLWYEVNSESKTHTVGKRKPNAWGLYDMIGNVWEWNEDWYDSGYYSNGEAVDPRGPSSGSLRVFRGGSWYNNAGFCRSSYRYNVTPDRRNRSLGFRLARTP